MAKLAFHENLGMRLRGAYLTLHRRTDAHFARWGMTSDQFVVLRLLAEEDGITQQELSQRAFSDPNTITAMLRLLERHGLVRREPHPTDRRARRVLLTPQGKARSRQLTASMAAFEREFRATLPPGSDGTVLEWLSRVAEVMSSTPTRRQPR